jgi:hypothetical protein
MSLISVATAIGYFVGISVFCYVVLSVIHWPEPITFNPFIRYGFPVVLVIATLVVAMLLYTPNTDPNRMSDSELVESFKLNHVAECTVSSGNVMSEENRAFCKCAADRIAAAHTAKELWKLRENTGYHEQPRVIALTAPCREPGTKPR